MGGCSFPPSCWSIKPWSKPLTTLWCDQAWLAGKSRMNRGFIGKSLMKYLYPPVSITKFLWPIFQHAIRLMQDTLPGGLDSVNTEVKRLLSLGALPLRVLICFDIGFWDARSIHWTFPVVFICLKVLWKKHPLNISSGRKRRHRRQRARLTRAAQWNSSRDMPGHGTAKACLRTRSSTKLLENYSKGFHFMDNIIYTIYTSSIP